MKFTPVTIAGRIPGEWLSDGHDRIALSFPGRNYSNDQPGLSYPAALLLDNGWDVLRVNYDHTTERDSEAADIALEARAAYGVLPRLGAFRARLVVGKSLGSFAAAALAGEDVERFVWLTPLLHLADVAEAMRAVAPRSFVGIGSADPMYDAGVLEELRDAGALVHVLDGADHGFLIPGDMPGAARSMASMLDALDAWL